MSKVQDHIVEINTNTASILKPSTTLDRFNDNQEPVATKPALVQAYTPLADKPKVSKESLNEVGNYIRLNYHSWFNQATVVLHAMGAMLPFVNIVPKNVANAVKQFAIQFSRWGMPLVKLHTGWEALKGNRFYEAVARVLPPLFLPFLSFSNFHCAYGLSSGVNVVLEHMNHRIGELSKNDSMEHNRKKVEACFKSMLGDLVTNTTANKERFKLGLALPGSAFMIAGALPILLFARKSVNNAIAKIFGSTRAIGGLLGDLSIILFSSKTNPVDKRKEQLVGSLYLIPSMMDFAQRWMNQDSDVNEIFNHAKTAINTVAEVLWSTLSTDRTSRQEKADRAVAMHSATAV